MEDYIYEKLIDLEGRKRSDMVKSLAKQFNCSISTIWRRAHAMGITGNRKERIDKGKSSIDDKLLEHIGALLVTSRRKNDKYTFKVKDIIRHLKYDLGMVIDVGYGRITELLRKKGYTVKEFKKPAPCIQLISEHPNQLHQFDVSICLQWYFNEKKSTFESQVTSNKYYLNKVEATVEKELKGKNKLHRYVLVDHCSGAFFFWYYYALGENAVDGLDFFFKAWRCKKPLISQYLDMDYNGNYIFQGIPKILYSDNGAILRKTELRNLMKSLNVDVQFHKPGNPRAKGMVEGLMNIIETGFESLLKIKGINSIEELNAHALKWCIEKNCRQGFRIKSASRANLWRKIRQEEFIKCPDIDIWLKLLSPNEITRKVDINGVIEFDGNRYTVTNTELINNNVIVQPNAFEYPAIDVHFNGEVYKLEPNIQDDFGRKTSDNNTKIGKHKHLKETSNQKFKKRAEILMEENYNTSFVGKGNKRSMKPPVESATGPKIEENNLYTIEPTSTTLDINLTKKKTTSNRDIRAKRVNRDTELLLPLSDLIRMYVAEYGRITPDQRDKLVELYPKGVPTSITATDIYNMLNTKDRSKIVKLG